MTLSASFNVGLEFAQNSQHVVVQQKVNNPFEENEVIGITNYIDFGFELVTRNTRTPEIPTHVEEDSQSRLPMVLLVRNFKAQLVANALKQKAEVGEAALKNLTLDSVKRRSIKPPKSLTAVLSARSKVACGITARPKDPVVNIDASDINNELAKTEYCINKRADSSYGEGHSRSVGFMISADGIHVDEKKIKVIQDWPTPQTIGDV
nr:hypothetical protein [Tanacetum cinerariifolium]